MSLANWLRLAIVFVFVAFSKRPAAGSKSSARCAPSAETDRDEARARYEFDVVHREYGNHCRTFDSSEAGLGVITLVAVKMLMAVYFPDPKTVLERVLEMALGGAAAIGCIGFMLFRGYEPFTLIEFQRNYRGDPSRALRRFVDRMTELHSMSERAVRAKRTCGWIGLSIVTMVEIVTSVVRWHGL